MNLAWKLLCSEIISSFFKNVMVCGLHENLGKTWKLLWERKAVLKRECLVLLTLSVLLSSGQKWLRDAKPNIIKC